MKKAFTSLVSLGALCVPAAATTILTASPNYSGDFTSVTLGSKGGLGVADAGAGWTQTSINTFYTVTSDELVRNSTQAFQPRGVGIVFAPPVGAGPYTLSFDYSFGPNLTNSGPAFALVRYLTGSTSNLALGTNGDFNSSLVNNAGEFEVLTYIYDPAGLSSGGPALFVPSEATGSMALANQSGTFSADFQLTDSGTAAYGFFIFAEGNSAFDNVGLTVVPEPASAALLAFGALTILRRRRTN